MNKTPESGLDGSVHPRDVVAIRRWMDDGIVGAANAARPGAAIRCLLVLGMVLSLVLATLPALAAPPDDLDAYAERAMQMFGMPGMSIVIVEGDNIETRAYGVRKSGSPERVDVHTSFPIGSNTKAFTATALGILVDDGKLRWDDRVADRLPGFRMYDPYASTNMTVTDLLVHRSGLGMGQGELLFFPDTDRTRAEVVHALRHLKPASTFRGEFAYENVLYAVAGQLVEAVSGQTWEDFVRQRILGPLGMRDAAVNYASQGANHASPHTRTPGTAGDPGPLKALASDGVADPIAPAGGICASAEDMGRWLRAQLARGALGDGNRLFTAATSEALWTPVVTMPIAPSPPPVAAVTPQFREYALGFVVQDYRGHKVITHGGAVNGAISDLVIIPERNVAFMVMVNSEDVGGLFSVYYRLLDHFLQLPPSDWIARYHQVFGQAQAMAAASQPPKQSRRGSVQQPFLPLDRYAGTYRDPWYGTMTISEAKGGLRIRFDRSPGMEGALEHAQYNTFRTHWDDRSIGDAYVTFDLDPDGSIRAIRMEALPPGSALDYQDLHFVPATAADEAAR